MRYPRHIENKYLAIAMALLMSRATALVMLMIIEVVPVLVGYQLSMLGWGVGFSVAILITVAFFYESGKFHGSSPSGVHGIWSTDDECKNHNIVWGATSTGLGKARPWGPEKQ
ncbi:hypothetical protein U1710_10405 [Aeromonas caviae]|uniref:hypothetical protein n=1 Tax=Aeromonas caviae TaxID=648 RepID=UPI00301526B2